MIELVPAFQFSTSRQTSEHGTPFLAGETENPIDPNTPYSENVLRIVRYHNEVSGSSDYEDLDYGVKTYVKDALETASMRSYCLKCGKEISSSESYPLFISGFGSPIFYRFNCCVDYYHIIGFQPPSLIGILIPESKTVLSFFNYDHPVARAHWSTGVFTRNVLGLYTMLARHQGLVAQYRASRSERRLCLAVAFCCNLGHQFREELPMLYKRLAHAGPAAPTDYVLGPYQFLSIAKLLKGGDLQCSYDDRDPNVLVERVFGDALRRDRFMMLPCSADHIPDSMAAGVIESAEDEEAEFFDAIRQKLSGRRPVVWFTLRSHSRYWVDQVSGHEQIIRAVRQRHPDAAFILDGMERERPLASELMGRFDAPDFILNCAGTSVRQALLIFRLATTFAMPYSNAAFLTMILPKRGIFHGIRGWFSVPTLTLVPRAEPVYYDAVVGDCAPSGDADYDADVHTANYDVDPEEITDKLLEIL